MLDAGHGGSDGGASANGLLEKNLTMKIVKKISEMLQDYTGYELYYTRTNQSGVTLKQRTDGANKMGVDLFLSIHINAGGGDGFESYIYKTLSNSSKTNKLRNTLHKQVIKSTKWKDRGKKKENFHVLRETKMHAILTENGFIDNSKDASKLKQDAFIEKIARGHVNGLVKIYGLKKKNRGSSNVMYEVIAGTFKNKGNADEQAKKIKKAGFDAYVKKE